MGLAGHHVADDWLQTRARVEEGLQQFGRACGGKHGAGVCRIKRAVMAATAPEPSGTLIPAATEDRRAADSAADEVMRAATKKAKMVAALKTA